MWLGHAICSLLALEELQWCRAAWMQPSELLGSILAARAPADVGYYAASRSRLLELRFLRACAVSEFYGYL